jgi:hypothetical protein
MRRTLRLRGERLVELTVHELTEVVAGQVPSGPTCPVKKCLPTTSTEPSWWGCPTSGC